MTLLLACVGMALGFSFLCSILEAVLLSVTPGYIARLEQGDPKIGGRLRLLKANVDRPLAAILSLNTIANTAGAAGVGAQAHELWGGDALAITSAVLTLLILVCSEIIPKTLGAVFWRRLAPFAARVLPVLIVLLFPLVVLSERLTKVLKRGEGKQGVNREEFEALAKMAGQQGLFDESESRILQSLFRFGSLKTRDVMTPRTVVFQLHESTTVAEVLERREAMVFSRIPVYRDSPDDVRGYVLKDELFLRAARDELDVPVADLVRELMVVPETLPVAALFEKLLDQREQIALVVDEYGGADGVVTMEDVLETLLGLEIVDEADAVQDMRAMARAKWRERAKRLVESSPPGPPDAVTSSEPAGD